MNPDDQTLVDEERTEKAMDPQQSAAADVGDAARGEGNLMRQPPAPQSSAAKPAATEPNFSGRGWLARAGLQAAIILCVAAILLIMTGAAQRSGWITSGTPGASTESRGASTGAGESGKRYICPMMCTPPSSEPGRCPVCAMELVEASSGGGGDGKSVTIDAAARRLVGIRTTTSQKGPVLRTIRTIGSIAYDESRLATISAYVDGRLEKMFADYVGVPVSAGDDLALLYSPKLYSAQTEYVTSLEDESLGRLGGRDNASLSEMARESLGELGMTDAQIETLRRTRTPQSRIRITSPRNGTVIEKAVVEGDYVKTGQKIYKVADLTSVWLMLDLFPDDAAAIRFGQQVEAEIRSLPGEVFVGRVAFIDPMVSPQTRTVRVRVEMTNLDGKLRPGDYATARISIPAMPSDLTYDPDLAGKYISPMHPQVIRNEPGKCPLCGMDLIPTRQLGFASEPLPEQEVVTVPRNTVLMAGGNSVLYVETEPGRFEVRRVSVGTMTDSEAVIVAGLAAGETVATDGNFLIDSQMQLAGNPSLLDPSKAPAFPPGPLQLPESDPVLLANQAGSQFDRAYDAYFELQAALAADRRPPPVAVTTLDDCLSQLVSMPDVPAGAQRQLDIALRHVGHLGGTLETAREAFRSISHAMLKAAAEARGPKTAQSLTHFYCPMVPGGGGDWMQRGGELANPYWGSEMLRCGEKVREMKISTDASPAVATNLR